MKRSSEAHERAMGNRQHEDAGNEGFQDSEIDQILADSFPASDAPPWTLGVAPALPQELREQRRPRIDR